MFQSGFCYNVAMFNWFGKTNNYLPPVRKADGTKTRVFVGVSGGVDSSVSAAILARKGYDVVGVFMKTYYPPEIQCDWREERLDAMRVCEHLGIPFLECDLEAEYKNNVFDYMVESYRTGITPNPDVFCNKYVKFGGFLKWAVDNGADYVATGHYAQHLLQKERTPALTSSLTQSSYSKYASIARSLFPWTSSRSESNETSVVHQLGKGRDDNKDQTYFLYQLGQDQLARALFPVGDIPKDRVRRLAKRYGLFTASKKDSQGLCFVGPVDMHDFLGQYIEQQPGDVLDQSGQVIGGHDGSFFLTIGQRTGFEIFPEHRTPNMSRMFIVAKDHEANTVTVSADRHAQESNTITLAQVSWVSSRASREKGGLEVGDTADSRIRHRGQLLPATLESIDGDRYTFHFETPHTGVARGQSLVLYRDDICLGGGIVV